MVDGYAKVNFWITGEGYVLVIVASTPLMNGLVRWGKEKASQNSYESDTYGSNKYAVEQTSTQQSWPMDHEDHVHGKQQAMIEQSWPADHDERHHDFENPKYIGNHAAFNQSWPLSPEERDYIRDSPSRKRH
jgi:hypothetical protein